MRDNSVLLIGNGINRPFNGPSWDELIGETARSHGRGDKLDLIRDLPASMQVIAATGNSVGTQMKQLASTLRSQQITPDHSALCQKLLSLPVEHILTTNYTFELEQAAGVPASKQRYYALRDYAFDKARTDKASRLHMWYRLPNGKKLWHIHGDVTCADSVVMGHYYYGRLLAQIREVVVRLMRFPADIRDQRQASWVDLFLTRDVYVLGFGLYLSEIDLWWLLGCKRLYFPDTHVHFYADEGLDAQRRLMLESYGVDVITIPLHESDYIDYYNRAVESIAKAMAREEKTQ